MASSSVVPLQGSRTRNFGLDGFRALAIVFVLLGHWMQHGQPPHWMRRWLGWAGVPGVELFFVLSGFLIGGIIVRLAEQEQFRPLIGLFRFWMRRWLRTLPLYLVFLLIWFRVDWRGPFSLATYPQYFFFLQNFSTPPPPFFELSWSLAVEEWFYLLYPLALFLLLRLRIPVRWAVLAATFIFLAIPPVLRWYLIRPENLTDLFSWVKMPVIFRLDSLMYGVAMAILAQRAARTWQALAKAAPIWICLLGGLQYLCIAHMDAILADQLARTFLFTAFSLLAALMIPCAVQLRITSVPIQVLISATSKWSYSMYLGHIVVIIFINNRIGALIQNGGPAMLTRWYVLYPLYGLATYALGALTYCLIEAPFLRWRDRTRWLTEPRSHSN